MKEIKLLYFAPLIFIVCLGVFIFRSLNHHKIIIIGAGAAGIAAAYELKEYKPLVLEKNDRIGGRIYTTYYKDAPVELGAIIPIEPGLMPKEIPLPSFTNQRYPMGIYYENKLVLCQSFFECLSKTKIPTKTQNKLIQIADRSRTIQVLDKKEMELFRFLFRAIFPGDPQNYVPTFHARSLNRWPIHFYKKGNGGFLEEIASRLSKKIELNREVQEIKKTDNNQYQVTVKNTLTNELSIYQSEYVIIATSPKTLEKLLPEPGPEFKIFFKSLVPKGFIVQAMVVKKHPHPDFIYIATNDLPTSSISKHKHDSFDVFYCHFTTNHSNSFLNLPPSKQSSEIERSCLYSINKVLGQSFDKLDILYSQNKSWDYVTTELGINFFASRSKITRQPSPGLFITGEYLDPSIPYTTGAALKSGALTGQSIKSLILQKAHSN